LINFIIFLFVFGFIHILAERSTTTDRIAGKLSFNALPKFSPNFPPYFLIDFLYPAVYIFLIFSLYSFSSFFVKGYLGSFVTELSFL